MISKISYNIKKTKFGRKIRNEVNLLLALYINQSITKKFPTEKRLEMMDSSVRSLGEVESAISSRVLIRKFFVMDRFSEKFEVHIATVHKSVPNKKFPNCNTFGNDRF